MGASTTADRYFFEKIYVVYEDNMGKLRLWLKLKCIYDLRGMVVYEFTKIINPIYGVRR